MKGIKKLRNCKVCFCFLFFLILFFFLFFFAQKTRQDKLLKELERQVSLQAENFSGTFSLSIYQPGIFGLEFDYLGQEPVVAASVIKIPILAAALQAVFEQKVAMDQKVLIMPADVIGGSGILKGIDLPIELTFEGLLLYMMAISDNTATNKVIDILGFEYINQVFSAFDLTETVLRRKMMDFESRRKGIENYTSSRDLVYLLKQIYHKRLFNEKITAKAKRLLLFQQHKDRIPLLLPEGVVTAHKTGLERGVVHDAGIVYGEKANFVIAVLTKNVSDYSEAKKFIAQISHLSYNLLN